jgi:hypothetical protein
MNARISILGAAAVLIIPICLFGDVIRLSGKRIYEGRIVSEDEKSVTIRTYDQGDVRVRKSKIKKIFRRRSAFDVYESQLKKTPKTAERHARLARWCKKAKLHELAEKEWKKVVELDANHEGAREALGYLKKDDAWVHKSSLGYKKYQWKWMKKKEAEEAYLKEQCIVLDLYATYPEDATRKQLFLFGERVEMASKYAWRLTQGQMWVRKVVVEDKALSGDMRIARDTWDSYKIRKGAYGQSSNGSHIDIAGKMLGYTFLHEMMHCIFWIADEYRPKCDPCIMSANPRADKLCDMDDHVGDDLSCWEKLVDSAPRASFRARAKGFRWCVRYPNPYKDFMTCPPTEIVVKDK